MGFYGFMGLGSKVAGLLQGLYWNNSQKVAPGKSSIVDLRHAEPRDLSLKTPALSCFQLL